MSNSTSSAALGALSVAALAIGIPVLAAAGLLLHGCNAVTSTAHRAISVTAAQFDPATMLKRYEWFKDASAQCEKKLADIKVYENRFKQLKSDYGDKPRIEWAREDREQYNLWTSEVAGVEASYNTLAAEYNAAMAKINFRFTNVGDLPAGATSPLPREFKPYSTGN